MQLLGGNTQQEALSIDGDEQISSAASTSNYDVDTAERIRKVKLLEEELRRLLEHARRHNFGKEGGAARLAVEAKTMQVRRVSNATA